MTKVPHKILVEFDVDVELDEKGRNVTMSTVPGPRASGFIQVAERAREFAKVLDAAVQEANTPEVVVSGVRALKIERVR